MNRLLKSPRQLIDRLDFWSIREPEAPPGLKDLPRPSEILKGLKGYRLLAELSHSNPTIYSAIQAVSNMLFYYLGNEDHFEIECGDPTISKIVEEELFSRNTKRRKFGWDIYDLTDFLRKKGVELMTFGKSYTLMKWEQQGGQDSRWSLKCLEGLNPENVKPLKKGIKVTRYKWKHRQNKFDQNSPIITEHLAPEEVLSLEWVFDGERNRGRSPLERVTKYYWEDLRLMALSVASAYAWANPNDKKFWVERARHVDIKKVLEQQKKGQLLMTKELGVFPQYPLPPVTTYYDVYCVVKFRKRLAQMRDYLVAQFNNQVVRQLATRNGFGGEVALKTVGYHSGKEIEEIFKRFEQGELTTQEVIKMLS